MANWYARKSACNFTSGADIGGGIWRSDVWNSAADGSGTWLEWAVGSEITTSSQLADGDVFIANVNNTILINSNLGSSSKKFVLSNITSNGHFTFSGTFTLYANIISYFGAAAGGVLRSAGTATVTHHGDVACAGAGSQTPYGIIFKHAVDWTFASGTTTASPNNFNCYVFNFAAGSGGSVFTAKTGTTINGNKNYWSQGLYVSTAMSVVIEDGVTLSAGAIYIICSSGTATFAMTGNIVGNSVGYRIELSGNCTATYSGNITGGSSGYAPIAWTTNINSTFTLLSGTIQGGAGTSGIDYASIGSGTLIINGNVIGGSGTYNGFGSFASQGIFCPNSSVTVNGNITGTTQHALVCKTAIINGNIVNGTVMALVCGYLQWTPSVNNYFQLSNGTNLAPEPAASDLRKNVACGSRIGRLSSGGAFGRFRRIDQ
jgi:hypothetical protein